MLSKEYVRACAQVLEYQETANGSSGQEYMVSYSQGNPGEFGANWHCSCPGFKFRKDCKHVQSAQGNRCTHGSEALAGSPVNDWGDDGECPECGEPSEVVTIAV